MLIDARKQPPKLQWDAMTMTIGGRYNWKGQPERLVYLGNNFSGNGFWHQFAKVDSPTVVWCEVKGNDLQMFEETPTQEGQAMTDAKADKGNTMNDDTTMWAVHVQGPDDIHACPDREVADALALLLNRQFKRQNDATMAATVIEWPYSYESWKPESEQLLFVATTRIIGRWA